MAPRKKNETVSGELKEKIGTEEIVFPHLDPLHPLMEMDEYFEHIHHAVEKQRVSHAYIIEGAVGSGKKTLADYFAMSLLCESPQAGKPCGRCNSCRVFLSGNHPDLHRIGPDEKGTIPTALVREKLVNDIEVLPYRSGRKVYILDQAHKLNQQAQNVLLKTIEEPPEYGVILLLSENSEAFLPTVRSRCIEIKLRPLMAAAVERILTDAYAISPEKAGSAAAFSDGSVGQAIRMALSEAFAERYARWMEHMTRISQAAAVEIFGWSSDLEKDKDHLTEVIRIMMIWFRDVLVLHETAEMERCFCREYAEDLRRAVALYSVEELTRKIGFLEEASEKLAHNVNFALWCDWLLLGLSRH